MKRPQGPTLIPSVGSLIRIWWRGLVWCERLTRPSLTQRVCRRTNAGADLAVAVTELAEKCANRACVALFTARSLNVAFPGCRLERPEPDPRGRGRRRSQETRPRRTAPKLIRRFRP